MAHIRPRRGSLGHRALATALAVGVLGAAALTAPSAASPAAAPARLSDQPDPATVFQISSFNVLGAGHTDGKGGRGGWESGYKRMGYANELLQRESIDVVGFQELQPIQLERFNEDLGSQFEVYPGARMSNGVMHNSIAWRTSMWTMVEQRTIPVPYFKGNEIAKPYVLLRHNETGQRAWFYNTHHPADARGPAQKWRDEATRIETSLFNRLARDYPGVPVFATGDMNDREEVFCPYLRESNLVAANGGGYVDGVCTPPSWMRVDWIFGSAMATFTGYADLRDELVAKTTDHAMIVATATIPPTWAQELPVRRVLALEVDGLRPWALQKLGAAGAPSLTRMRQEGSSTNNARTSVEQTTAVPNTLSLLTGRPVDAASGGHGVDEEALAGPLGETGTVHEAAGRYTSTIFDLVHNKGGATALFTSDERLSLLDRSYGEEHGGRDPFGVDDGADKIDRFVLTDTDAELVAKLTRTLPRTPRRFTLVHLADVARAGQESGFGSRSYLDAVAELDALVGQILETVESAPKLRGKTLVVLTATGGGFGTDQSDPTVRQNYKVPVIAWGAGVPAGGGLYRLNPAYQNPRKQQPPYDAAPPVRVGSLANTILAALRLPAIPGSRLNTRQDLNLFLDR
ncbi:alkaline phosphatase family protein [Nocardioides ferulae]|uniref:alkaline phosphatase family protein n=1 Tax=Nocardioides ferulae TaxID=2340821 RepID=UPI000EB16BF1|nr:alkaline phosphatase family protein [Nocardioides ferulae]